MLCAFVSRYRSDRERVRSLVAAGGFVEVFIDADVETCRARDPKGLYKRAPAGQVEQFTGVSAPYERPTDPELTLDSTRMSAEQAAERVLEYLRAAVSHGVDSLRRCRLIVSSGFHERRLGSWQASRPALRTIWFFGLRSAVRGPRSAIRFTHHSQIPLAQDIHVVNHVTGAQVGKRANRERAIAGDAAS